MEPALGGEIFVYPPFQDATKQIRLLHVRSDTKDVDINCTLKVYPLSQLESDCLNEKPTPAYRAISYTWEGQSPSESIFVNGVNVLVTRNCRQALWQAHLHQAAVSDEDRAAVDDDIMPVFVDAVCIDQKNPQEKGAQVQLMGRIFADAYETLISLVWDGEENDVFFEGLDAFAQKVVLRSSFADFPATEDTVTLMPDIRRHRGRKDGTEFIRYADDISKSSMTFDSADGVFDTLVARFGGLEKCRPWFSRLWIFTNLPYWWRAWIVQEILPKSRRRIMCGVRTFELEMLELVLTAFEGAFPPYTFGEERLLKMSGTTWAEFDHATVHQNAMYNALRRVRKVKGRGYKGDKWQTATHIWRMDLLGCREPRDRVYCLLAILLWRESTGPPMADYVISSTQVVLNTIRNLHANEMSSTANCFEAVLVLATWLKLAPRDLEDLLTERLERQIGAPGVAWRSGEHPQELCTGVHVTSKSAAPSPISEFAQVFRSSTGRFAISMYGDHSKSAVTFAMDNRRPQGKPNANLVEVHYKDYDGRHTLVDCEIAVPLEEGDIVALVKITVGRSHRDTSWKSSDQEVWILRKARGIVYEIVACGQLRGIPGDLRILSSRMVLSERPQNSVDCACYSNRPCAIGAEGTSAWLELHLDPEDVLSYAIVNSGREDFANAFHGYATGERTFCRSRFSSFATVRPLGQHVDDDMSVCIHCGEDLRSQVELQ